MKNPGSQNRKNKYGENAPPGKLKTRPVENRFSKTAPQVKDLTYEEFNKTASKVPFTLAEWAAILHISERTLQRYAKSNGTFAPINAERFYQICQVIGKGKKVFGNTNQFYEWLHANPPALEGELSFLSLTTFEGIQQVINQLGRIEHGILA